MLKANGDLELISILWKLYYLSISKQSQNHI